VRRQLHRGPETLLAGAALVGLAFAVLFPHVRDGGFYSDDWGNAASYHFDGWWQSSVHEWRHDIPQRPILALLHPLPYAAFGVDPTGTLALAVALAALTSAAFFAFLRALGIERRHALPLAALSLLFPWSDATRLWPTGSANNVAVIAYFAGTVVALRGLDLVRVDRRRSRVCHGIAAALYAASILTYEVAPMAILLSGLLYRTRATWRELRARWAFDAGLVVVLLAIALRVTSRVRHVGSPAERIADIPHFVGQTLTLFASMFVPPGASAPWTASWGLPSPATGKVAVLVAVAVVVALAAVRSGSNAVLRRWLVRAAGGAVAVAAAYFMFLGSGLVPLFYPGVDDRSNTLAAYGFVVVAYSVVVLAASLLSRGRRPVTTVLVAVGALAVGAGFVARVRDDMHRYDAATVEQRHVLERLRLALPHLAPASTIYTFDYPAEVAPGVPIFKYTWDLKGAVRLAWNDRTLAAAPVYDRRAACGAREVTAPELGAASAAAYGHVVFVDVATGRTRRIGSRTACLSARRTFEPGRLASP